MIKPNTPTSKRLAALRQRISAGRMLEASATPSGAVDALQADGLPHPHGWQHFSALSGDTVRKWLEAWLLFADPTLHAALSAKRDTNPLNVDDCTQSQLDDDDALFLAGQALLCGEDSEQEPPPLGLWLLPWAVYENALRINGETAAIRRLQKSRQAYPDAPCLFSLLARETVENVRDAYPKEFCRLVKAGLLDDSIFVGGNIHDTTR